MSREFIVKQVKDELLRQGLSDAQASSFSFKAGEFFYKSVCNSKDPFKDSCDYAGMLAQSQIKGFKYKPPKSKSRSRTKRPQEAFNFGQ